MAFIEVNDNNIAAVLEREFSQMRTVVLRFGSLWCSACHTLECELKEVYETMDNLTVLTVDTDESPDLTSQFDINLLPTMIVLKTRDHILYRGEGVMPAQEIAAIIKT